MKHALVTGGTSGIGKATVAGMATRGYHVIFIARNKEKGEAVRREVMDSTGKKHVDYLLADFTSIRQVNECAEAFKKSYPKLDVLINNAGVCLPQRRITEDGLEESFHINHLSHFILTNILLDELKKSDDPRIINVSSAAHSAGRFDPDNLHGEKVYSPIRTYANTKLINILFTLELAERLKDTEITVNALHPGVVSTNFGNEFGGFFNNLYKLGKYFMISPEKGSVTSIYLATSEEVKYVTGKYFVRRKTVKLKNPFLTDENRKLLWQKSLELAGIKSLRF